MLAGERGGNPHGPGLRSCSWEHGPSLSLVPSHVPWHLPALQMAMPSRPGTCAASHVPQYGERPSGSWALKTPPRPQSRPPRQLRPLPSTKLPRLSFCKCYSLGLKVLPTPPSARYRVSPHTTRNSPPALGLRPQPSAPRERAPGCGSPRAHAGSRGMTHTLRGDANRPWGRPSSWEEVSGHGTDGRSEARRAF